MRTECREIRSCIRAQIDGELDASFDRRLQEHMAECADCKKVHAAMAMVRQAAAQMQALPVSLQFSPRLFQKIKETDCRGQETGEQKIPRPVLRLGAALALSAVLYLAIRAPSNFAGYRRNLLDDGSADVIGLSCWDTPTGVSCVGIANGDHL